MYMGNVQGGGEADSETQLVMKQAPWEKGHAKKKGRRETYWQGCLRDEFKLVGAIVLNKIGTAQEGGGWPDLWIGSPHFQGWLEVKTETGKFRDDQVTIVRHMRRCGVPAGFIRMPSMRLFDHDEKYLGQALGRGIKLLKNIAEVLQKNQDGC